MSLKSLDSRGHAVPWIGSVCPEITTSRHSHQDFTLEFPFRIFSKIHLKGSWTRPPKYSCRDCFAGEYPMKNDQQEQDTKPLWGLTKRPLSNKPKEERILETVNRVITRIQNDERKCLWPNTLTKLAWGCLWPSRKTWPPSVISSKSMNQTWCVKRLSSSSRTSNKTQIRPHGTCSSEVTPGHPSDITPEKTSQTPCWGVFLCGYREGVGKGTWVIHRVGLSLRGIGSFTWPMGLPYGDIQRTPNKWNLTLVEESLTKRKSR